MLYIRIKGGDRMKILFINHSSNFIYGATKSLTYLLKMSDFKYDLIIPRSKSINNDEIKNIVGCKLSNIYRCYVPLKNSGYYGCKTLKLKHKVIYMLKNLQAYLFLFQIKNIINKNDYDIIYLNSLVLYPLINKKNKYIIHIREIFEGNSNLKKKIVNKLCQAKGVFFIDKSTEQPFSDYLGSFLTLNNPIDMRSVKKIEVAKIKEEVGIKEEEDIIFSIIGTSQEAKGIEFVIKAFKNAKKSNAYLLIVGNHKNNKYSDYCKLVAKDSEKIIFLEEMKEIEKIYAISDYIIRGESIFGIGRTVYEGLYSGCKVILPSSKKENEAMPDDLKGFEENVLFYQVRNIDHLSSVIKERSKCDKSKVKVRSNIEQYKEKWSNYLLKCNN